MGDNSVSDGNNFMIKESSEENEEELKPMMLEITSDPLTVHGLEPQESQDEDINGIGGMKCLWCVNIFTVLLLFFLFNKEVSERKASEVQMNLLKNEEMEQQHEFDLLKNALNKLQQKSETLQEHNSESLQSEIPEQESNEISNNHEDMKAIEKLYMIKLYADKAKENLLEYYHGDKNILEKAFLVPGNGNEVDKLIPKLLSVTAGHDNFGANTAWPTHLERKLKPVMEMAGIKLVVNNRAIGGIDPFPICICQSLLGGNADVIIREWEYWFLDSGILADIKKQGSQQDIAATEAFIRSVLMLPNQPAIQFLYLSFDGYDKTTFFRNWLQDKNGQLNDYFDRFAINAVHSMAAPFDHFRQNKTQLTNSSSIRIMRQTGKPCNKRDLRNINDCPIDMKIQDGYHTRAEYLGYDEQNNNAWRQFDVDGLFVNRDPAALGHEVIGYQVAYHYMDLVSAAATKLAQLIQDGKANAFIESLQIPRQLPRNQHCLDWFCEKPFNCAYSYIPKDPKSAGLKDWVLPGTRWTSERIIMGQPNYEQLNGDIKPDRPPKQRYEASKVLASLDRKYAITGTQQSGLLEIRIPSGLFRCQIWIFEPQRPWGRRGFYDAFFPDEYEFRINNKTCSDSGACTPYVDPDHSSMLIDARSLIGKSCRTNEVILSISMTPMKAENLNRLCEFERVKEDVSVCKPKRGSFGERTEDFDCAIGKGKNECVYAGPKREEKKVLGSIYLVMAN